MWEGTLGAAQIPSCSWPLFGRFLLKPFRYDSRPRRPADYPGGPECCCERGYRTRRTRDLRREFYPASIGGDPLRSWGRRNNRRRSNGIQPPEMTYGGEAASGIYYYRLDAAEVSAVRVLVKVS